MMMLIFPFKLYVVSLILFHIAYRTAGSSNCFDKRTSIISSLAVERRCKCKVSIVSNDMNISHRILCLTLTKVSE